MAFYQFSVKQFIPASIDQVWDYISSPKNLKEITPDYMGFEITSEMQTDKMYAGMIISYKVSPFLGIRLQWVTEITHVKEKEYFIDEQRIGPYSLWHHQHKIVAIEKGVLMTDIISYKPPFGIFGALVNSVIIKKQLVDIFEYRKKALEKVFGKFDSIYLKVFLDNRHH